MASLSVLSPRSALSPPSAEMPHPIYGTTIYIGRNDVETAVGRFCVLTYQDLIHKGYILALVHGDLERDGNGTVYTRLHSSCVTSGPSAHALAPPALPGVRRRRRALLTACARAHVHPRAGEPAETLGALDCDCVQQLNGALETIARKACGVLFYLIQEGRGCGYVGKSRDRMLVQVSPRRSHARGSPRAPRPDGSRGAGRVRAHRGAARARPHHDL